MVSLGDEPPEGLWDRIFAAIAKLDSPESLVGFIVWLAIYLAVCLTTPVGGWALPLFLVAAILGSGTGSAITTVTARLMERQFWPLRVESIMGRAEYLYTASYDVMPSDGDPIRLALVGTVQTFKGRLIDSLEANDQLDIAAKALSKAQRRVNRMIETGRLDQDAVAAIEHAKRSQDGWGFAEELSTQKQRLQLASPHESGPRVTGPGGFGGRGQRAGG